MPVRPSAAPARSAAVAAAALALALSACQDPSGVGLGLIGENGGTPTGVVVAADSVRLVEGDVPTTGGYGSGVTGGRAQARMLAGRVVDPIVGTATAAAYVDLVPPSTIPSGYRENAIESVTLRLIRDYVYGDTTATVDLELRAIAEDWDPLALPADTALAVGALIATYTVAASDSLVELALPAAWITANTALLRDEDFASEFHGFRLALAEGDAGDDAVLGFSTSLEANESGFLRVTTTEESVDFPIAETFTSVVWETGATPPPDRAVLRTADDETLAFTFAFDALDDLAIAGGAVRFDIDRTVFEGTPDFARPIPTSAGLYGITNNADSTRVLIASGTVGDDVDVVTFASGTLTALIQRAALGRRTFARFEVGLAISPISLGALPIVLGPAPATPTEERRPRLTLTVIPTAE